MVEFNVPNLDSLNPEELETLSSLFETLRSYASSKRAALLAQAAGETHQSLAEEYNCNHLYSSLPLWARW